MMKIAFKLIIRKFSVILIGLLVVLLFSGCVTYIGIDGPYAGKVIDADTKEPIVGAVVHGSWEKLNYSHPAPFYKSQEVLTDRNGEFSIPGVGFLFFSTLSMQVVIFKSEYDDQSWGSWNGIKTSLQSGTKLYDDKIEISGDKLIFKLRKSTIESRKNHDFGFVESNEPKDAHRLLDAEIAKDRNIFSK